MSDAGNALLGIGMGTGERRAIDAAEQAVASPLLETSMEGARSILLSITGGRDLSLWEVNEAAKAVAEAAHPDANIIFGAMVDEKLDDQVWVTVVATGYGNGRPAGAVARAPGCAARSTARVAPAADPGRVARWPRAARPSRDVREPAGEPRVSRVRGDLVAGASSTCQSSSRGADVLTCRFSPSRPGAIEPQLGVVAAGHPVTARTGADVLRARRQRGRRGDRGDARLVRVRAAAHRPRGRRLHAGRRSPGASRCCSTSSSRRRDAGADPAQRAELVPISVSFGDAMQVFNIGAASVGAYGLPAGLSRGARAVRPACRWPSSSRRPPRSLATASSSTPQQAYVIEILAGDRHLDARVRGAVRARRAAAARRRHAPPARARRRARAARGRGRGAVLHAATSPRRSSTGSRSAAGC